MTNWRWWCRHVAKVKLRYTVVWKGCRVSSIVRRVLQSSRRGGFADNSAWKCVKFIHHDSAKVGAVAANVNDAFVILQWGKSLLYTANAYDADWCRQNVRWDKVADPANTVEFNSNVSIMSWGKCAAFVCQLFFSLHFAIPTLSYRV